mmetsp:Transcript_15417/g.37899  ORF Transcript_15417/g.37899 Transcript_15417/m.37899 type:complete len:309 (+) Transcript_15417:2598-3524(+)
MCMGQAELSTQSCTSATIARCRSKCAGRSRSSTSVSSRRCLSSRFRWPTSPSPRKYSPPSTRSSCRRRAKVTRTEPEPQTPPSRSSPRSGPGRGPSCSGERWLCSNRLPATPASRARGPSPWTRRSTTALPSSSSTWQNPRGPTSGSRSSSPATSRPATRSGGLSTRGRRAFWRLCPSTQAWRLPPGTARVCITITATSRGGTRETTRRHTQSERLLSPSQPPAAHPGSTGAAALTATGETPRGAATSFSATRSGPGNGSSPIGSAISSPPSGGSSGTICGSTRCSTSWRRCGCRSARATPQGRRPRS